jgi:hypothetical protein
MFRGYNVEFLFFILELLDIFFLGKEYWYFASLIINIYLSNIVLYFSKWVF